MANTKKGLDMLELGEKTPPQPAKKTARTVKPKKTLPVTKSEIKTEKKSRLIAFDVSDYKKLRLLAIEEETNMTALVNEAVKMLLSDRDI